MRVIEITQPGGPDVLQPAQRPPPKPKHDEVLIKVAAAGVNRPDILQRMGRYPPPPGASDIPGLEIAGEIMAVGSGVHTWQAGDKVCALVTGGGYAEYCVAAAPLCLPVPHSLDLIQAAALPEACFTVWANLFELGKLGLGERLLIHGGTSGIGTMAIQLAKALRKAQIFSTCGSDKKCQFCEQLGVFEAINYRCADFAQRIDELTQGDGVDVILDIIGGPYLQSHFKILAKHGRLVIIGLQGGTKSEINLLPILVKHLTITGSTLRPRSVSEKATIATSLREQVWPLLEKAEVKPIIHATFPLEKAADAHRMMESSEHIGKILLLP